MSKVDYKRVKEEVKKAYIKACKSLPQPIIEKLREAKEQEKGSLSRRALEILLENVEVAQREDLPLCQDTGLPVVIVRFSEKGLFKEIEEAINDGIKEACVEGYLRRSVAHPLTRINTGTNTPAVIHYEYCKEELFEIWIMPKGCGSENMSKLAMLPPAKGLQGIKEFVLEVIKEAGPNPCPPLIVGIGIGGNFEKAAYLAKRALFRDPGLTHSDDKVANLEKELLESINKLGIGPLGFGGNTTALFVHIEVYPSHIASLPVAVNLQCHAARIEKIKFY